MKTRRFHNFTNFGIDYVVKTKIPDEVHCYPYSSKRKEYVPKIKAVYK